MSVFALKYSSWIDQIHYRFKAIEVLVFSAQRGKETVEVLEKYRPKPSVEWYCIRGSYTINISSMHCHCFFCEFFASSKCMFLKFSGTYFGIRDVRLLCEFLPV